MSETVNYGLLAFSAFIGVFAGEVAKDVYRFLKVHFGKVRKIVKP